MKKVNLNRLHRQTGMLISMIIEGTLYQGFAYRSPLEVTLERSKVAEFFSEEKNKAEVLISDIRSSFLMLNIDTTKLPDNFKLQQAINVFNTVTADQVLYEYGKELGEMYYEDIMDYLKGVDKTTT